MRYFIAICLLVVTSAEIFADEWYQGAVVLKNNKTLRGEIAVKYDHDVILYRIASEVMVFPAHKVRSFYIYDALEESNRQFVSLQLSIGAATYHQFYELILDGDVGVVRRQRVVWYSIHLDETQYDYFINHNEQLTAINKFRRHVLPELVRSSQGNIAAFVREHKLNPSNKADILLIIDYFNQRQANKFPLAKNR